MLRSTDRLPVRRHRNRGVVLIFVVAVLVLLAMIATTYLSMARVNSIVPDTRGGLVGKDDPVGLPLDELRLDVYDWTGDTALTAPYPPNTAPVPTAWPYRPAAGITGVTYQNFDWLDETGLLTTPTSLVDTSFRDRSLNDPLLASRVPQLFAPNTPAWRKISRWIERWDDNWVFDADPNKVGYFESPLLPAGQTVNPTYREVKTAVPTYVRIDYGTSFTTPIDYKGRNAVYPALNFPESVSASNAVYIAADADGDGVADAGLFPLTNWGGVTATPRPDGNVFYPPSTTPHKTRWYAGVRIVDNTSSINVNTAWRRNFDLPLPMVTGDAAATAPPAGALPNYGFFRSNIGLIELMKKPADLNQWTAFTNHRFGQASAAVLADSGRPDYTLTSAAEALEMNINRRLLNPGTAGNGPIYVPYDVGLSAGLAYHNGMINPNDSQSDLETNLVLELTQFAPNWATGVDGADRESRSFTFFAAPTGVPTIPAVGVASPLLWWHSMYNPVDTDRSTYFSSIGAYAGGPVPPLSIRHLLTTSNPQSTSVRAPQKLTPYPWLTPVLDTATQQGMVEPPVDARPKASINTDDFGVLWREFYVGMMDPMVPAGGTAAVPAEIDPNARTPALQLNSAGALYLRSALAAANAVDQRDGDDNVSTFRLDIGGRFVMVAGAEQQLFISEVRKLSASNEFQIVLTNPYDRDLPVAAYRVGYVPAGGGSYYGPPGPGSPVTLLSAAPSMPALVTKNGGTVTISIALPTDTAAQGDIVLLRTRRSDGVPQTVLGKNGYDETKPDQLVCVDLVDVGNYNAALPFDIAPLYSYKRPTVDWQVASAGTGFASNTGFRANPVALDILPATASRANVATGNRFPFGGFPRVGDIMTLPYIGHYAFYASASETANVLDATPITVDVLKVPDMPPPRITGRLMPALVTSPAPASYSNDWRSKIFDNFTTLANPSNDYLPNVAPTSWLTEVPNRVNPAGVIQNDPPAPTVAGGSQGGSDNHSPVHGLVNINTASEDVLKMVPFITNASGQIDPATEALNSKLVQDIILYRQTIAPFRSIADLMLVPGFIASTGGTAPQQGNIFHSALMPGPMTSYGAEYNGLARVSNLLTTRSDSFIVYVVLQCWQDYDTDKPVLLPVDGRFEQRFAAIVDRSLLRDAVDGDFRVQPVGSD